MKAFKLVGGLVLALSLTTAPAHALLLGHDLQIEWYFPDIATQFLTTAATVVDPGIEWSPGSGVNYVDITDDLIIISNSNFGWTGSSGFNGFVFTDINSSIADFTSLEIVSMTGYLPPVDPILSFTADTLSINFNASGSANVGEGMGQVYTFRVNGKSIPDASTLFLLGSACLIGFSGIRRKLRK